MEDFFSNSIDFYRIRMNERLAMLSLFIRLHFPVVIPENINQLRVDIFCIIRRKHLLCSLSRYGQGRVQASNSKIG